MLNDEYISYQLSNDLDDLDGITFVTPESKVPEDQRAIRTEIELRHQTSESLVQDVRSVGSDLDLSGFTSISLCVVTLICLMIFISRR